MHYLPHSRDAQGIVSLVSNFYSLTHLKLNEAVLFCIHLFKHGQRDTECVQPILSPLYPVSGHSKPSATRDNTNTYQNIYEHKKAAPDSYKTAGESSNENSSMNPNIRNTRKDLGMEHKGRTQLSSKCKAQAPFLVFGGRGRKLVEKRMCKKCNF